MISTIMVSFAAILIAIALYNMSRQKSFMEGYWHGLKESLEEATAVKQDLEEMMAGAVEISKDLVSAIDLRREGYLKNEERSLAISQMLEREVQIDIKPICGATGSKTRIYELAKTMGVPTRELLQLVRELGIQAANHMKSLEDHEVVIVRTHLAAKRFLEIPHSEQEISNAVSDLERSCLLEPAGGMILPGFIEAVKESKMPGFSMQEIKSAHPYMAVRTLSEQGYTVSEIAQILGRGQGEISLILNLANKKHAVS